MEVFVNVYIERDKQDRNGGLRYPKDAGNEGEWSRFSGVVYSRETGKNIPLPKTTQKRDGSTTSEGFELH